MEAPFSDKELLERFPLSMGIQDPQDLKKLTPEQLPLLAAEYRDFLIEICSRNGGHIGASLGVVELTLALHYAFNSPDDRILWDIGHQAYNHKLLTGRMGVFHTIRKDGGLSGFLKRNESKHDIIGAGHAATSVSFAVGIAEALRRKGDKHKAVAIIGDGALTSGMAYEALQQRQEWKKNLVVILNDNQMSISPNIGAVNAFLTRQMSSPFVSKLQDDVKQVLSNVPFIGDELVEVASRVKHSVKNLIHPTVIFEAMGFKYIGPIDGHDMPLMIETFNNVKEIDAPVLVHVITEKGRGYDPAIQDKVTFHGCGPYDRESGKLIKKPGAKPTYSKVYSETLAMLAKKDPKVIAITGAMPTGTGLVGFEEKVPEQFYDVGIAEQHAVTFAGGLAIEGLTPFATIYSTFLQRGYDQIIHDICIQRLNVKFGMDRAGFAGDDGETHHGIFDISYLRIIPEMVVCAPRDEREMQELLKAMSKHEGPAAIRYPRGEGPGVDLYQSVEEIPDLKWESAEVVYFSAAEKEGEARPRALPLEWVERMVKSHKARIDVVLVGYGATVEWSIEAAEVLRKEGIEALVINARFVKPFDTALFKRVAALCGRWITSEEHSLMGGFGSAVLEFVQAQELQEVVRVKSLGLKDIFYQQASQLALQKQAGIDPESIAATARTWVESERSVVTRTTALGA